MLFDLELLDLESLLLLLEPLLGSGTGARRPRAWRPVTQLGAMRVQPRSWVAVTVPPKETRFGSTAELLPPPNFCALQYTCTHLFMLAMPLTLWR